MHTSGFFPLLGADASIGRAQIRRSLPVLLAWLMTLIIAGCGGSDAPSGESAAADATSPAPLAAAPAETAQSALARANVAFRANRIVEPAGDNALEHALKAIQLDPRNAGANEIIVDITPIAASAIEAYIKSGNLAEAQRVMGVLASASPDSLIVQNLQRRLEVASRVAEAAAVASARAAAVPPPTTAANPSTDSEPVAAPARPEQAPVASAAATPAPASTRPAAVDTNPTSSPPTVPSSSAAPPTTAPATAAPVVRNSARPTGTSSDPVPIVKVAPEYPAAAKKRRAEGWVELQFVVGINGVASQIEVVRAQPEGIFDRAAIRALSRWKFKPGERDGEVIEARARTTINFKLG